MVWAEEPPELWSDWAELEAVTPLPLIGGLHRVGYTELPSGELSHSGAATSSHVPPALSQPAPGCLEGAVPL